MISSLRLHHSDLLLCHHSLRDQIIFIETIFKTLFGVGHLRLLANNKLAIIYLIYVVFTLSSLAE